MKKLLLTSIGLALFLGSCSVENKRIYEELSDEEIISLIEKDPIYEEVLLEIDRNNKWFSSDPVLNAKYKSFKLRFKDYIKGYKSLNDTALLREWAVKGAEAFDKLEDSLGIKAKGLLQGEFNKYLERIKKNNPNEYFTVSDPVFTKDCYSWGSCYGYNKTWIKITPTQGPISAFKVKMKARALDGHPEEFLRVGESTFESNKIIDKPTYLLYRGPDYRIERLLDDASGQFSTNKKSRPHISHTWDYDNPLLEFNFEGLMVEIEGTNIDLEAILEGIPKIYHNSLSKGELPPQVAFNRMRQKGAKEWSLNASLSV